MNSPPAGDASGRRTSFDAHRREPRAKSRAKRAKGKAVESRIVISLSEVEAMQVERIALDRDKEEALRMIEKVILKKVREASAPH